MRLGDLFDELAEFFSLVLIHLIERIDQFLSGFAQIFQKVQTALPVQEWEIVFVFRLAETSEHYARQRIVEHRFWIID